MIMILPFGSQTPLVCAVISRWDCHWSWVNTTAALCGDCIHSNFHCFPMLLSRHRTNFAIRNCTLSLLLFLCHHSAAYCAFVWFLLYSCH